eukprot:UN28177
MTSYRDNGTVVVKGLEDVRNLIKYIQKKYGVPDLFIVEGRSMGGGIGTLLAECPDVHQMNISGILAIGAAIMWPRDEKNPIELTYKPFIPILYLTNRSETSKIQDYAAKCTKNCLKNESESICPPAVWRVDREGHNWVNTDERLAALDGLLCWLQHGTFITKRKNKTTEKSKVPPSSTTVISKNKTSLCGA